MLAVVWRKFAGRYQKKQSNSRAGVIRRHLSNATRPVLENLEDRTLMSFTAPVYYGGGATPIAVISADLNNDGHKDILASNSVTNTISASLGNGDGTFQ